MGRAPGFLASPRRETRGCPPFSSGGLREVFNISDIFGSSLRFQDSPPKSKRPGQDDSLLLKILPGSQIGPLRPDPQPCVFMGCKLIQVLYLFLSSWKGFLPWQR